MIRLATPADAEEAVDLLTIVLRDMELPILTQLPEEQLRDMLIEAFHSTKTYRYGFKNALVNELDGKVAGIAFGYSANDEPIIDDVFNTILKSQSVPEHYRLFNEPEVYENEWYLDTLVTSANFRGKGVATRLLQTLPDLANQAGHDKIGLNVDQINHHARSLYVNKGFSKVGELTISNHLYDHMQKSC
ncbi:GNAT family N-acetyltransferase [Vagococcus acidifermentans]|uniref:N-acetyltransferase domain-containing protein n=1 Tax=Vagococcus acidifermentans TaxID=564710 RepID=A0A430AT21_9ENTE|nr:GNAT family N-acetyltransferase [Vagococcus acidifermentans]RSU11208.1 hypothetical protein CBF27_08915 [Vagococcus acidifermentans]